jgi:glycosyltransferase involved in cell wall biosynthesis
MRILFITASYLPHIGGVEKSVARVSEGLHRCGHHVTIVTSNDVHNTLPACQVINPPSADTVYRIPHSSIPKTGRLKIWFWFAQHFSLLLASDVIHFHDHGTLTSWFLPFRFLLFWKRYYITFHGYEGYPLQQRHIRQRRRAERLTRGNICVGSFIPKWYGTTPSAVYWAAVDEVAEQPLCSDEKKILFVGRLERDTGILAYLETLRKVHAQINENFTLQICGDGSLRTEIENLARQCSFKTELLGFVENVGAYIKQARIVLATSYLAIAEALAVGKIIVAYYHNELKRDYLKTFPQQKELFLCTGDSNELTHLIANAYAHQEQYDHLKHNGLEFAKRNRWANVVELYLKLYSST